MEEEQEQLRKRIERVKKRVKIKKRSIICFFKKYCMFFTESILESLKILTNTNLSHPSQDKNLEILHSSNRFLISIPIICCFFFIRLTLCQIKTVYYIRLDN